MQKTLSRVLPVASADQARCMDQSIRIVSPAVAGNQQASAYVDRASTANPCTFSILSFLFSAHLYVFLSTPTYVPFRSGFTTPRHNTQCFINRLGGGPGLI